MNIRQIESIALVEFELRRIEEIKRTGEDVAIYLPFSAEEFRNSINLYTHLPADTLNLLKLFLISLRTNKNRYRNKKLGEFFNRFHNYEELISEIESRIDGEAQIRDSASLELYKIRMKKKRTINEIKRLLKELLDLRPYLFTELNIVERVGRYVLPVKANFKNELKGIVHSYSNSRETVFIEPMETTPLSAELGELERMEEEEIISILKEITKMVKERRDDIESDLDYAAELDLLFAKVNYAKRYNCSRPLFGDHLDIKNGYHPLLKHLKDNVVPLNMKLPPDKRVLLISGPNAGGKTVVLKTVGLLALMARCGLYIPADEGTVLPFFSEIYADIGDEQSLESDLSTFAGHIRHIKEALNAKGQKNLVLLDELMNQTSVEEGSALASAIMEELSEKGNIVLATTHNESLKIFVSKREDMLNGGMEFTDRPTYRLILGIPQPSNAIRLAEKMGINGRLLERARSYLDTQKASLNELFENLARELKGVEEERARLNELIKDYETKLKELEMRRREEFAQLRNRFHNEMVKAKRRIDELIMRLKKEGARPEIVKESREFFDQELKKGEPSKPYHPELGEVVRIKGSNKPGQVLAVHQGRYKISFGNIYFWARPEEIEPEKGNG